MVQDFLLGNKVEHRCHVTPLSVIDAHTSLVNVAMAVGDYHLMGFFDVGLSY